MKSADDMHRRLRLWGAWVARNRTGRIAFARAEMRERVDCEVTPWHAGASMPGMEDECEETEAAIRTLPAPLPETLHRVYVAGGGMREKARLLRVTERAVYARVDAAKVLIASWLSESARRKREARELAERTQAAARGERLAAIERR